MQEMLAEQKVNLEAVLKASEQASLANLMKYWLELEAFHGTRY